MEMVAGGIRSDTYFPIGIDSQSLLPICSIATHDMDNATRLRPSHLTNIVGFTGGAGITRCGFLRNYPSAKRNAIQ